jgi:hypothetical protein
MHATSAYEIIHRFNKITLNVCVLVQNTFEFLTKEFAPIQQC